MKRILAIIAGSVCCCVTATSQRSYTLEQMKDSALHNNIAIRSAKYNIETAQQQRKEAFTKYFPNVSGTGLWFNANHGMAQTTLNLSENISPELGAALAQSLPPEALAALGNPISISMMKNGTIAGVQAVQPVFAGGQIGCEPFAVAVVRKRGREDCRTILLAVGLATGENEDR